VLALGVLVAALVASLGLSPARGEVVQTEREHAVRAPETAAAVAYGAVTSTPPVNVPCTTPGTTGNRIQAVYAYFGTAGNRVATSRPYIVDALKRANGIVYYSARQTGGTRHLRTRGKTVLLEEKRQPLAYRFVVVHQQDVDRPLPLPFHGRSSLRQPS
jgi:hypothetical protein